MKLRFNQVGLTAPKIILTAILCVIGFLSLIYVRMTSNAVFSYFYCFATVGFALLPPALMLLFRCKFNMLFYVFFSAYTFGPLLGAVYNFYYFTSWWDDLLHVMAGTVFAVVGAYLAVVMNKNQKTPYMLSTLFGVLFSMGIAVFWEFFEFSSDMLLQSDMQADTIISTVATKINLTDGSVKIFENVTDTAINGQSLGINGYLDIGLIDTMSDIFVETVGAFIFFLYALFDKDRHPLIYR